MVIRSVRAFVAGVLLLPAAVSLAQEQTFEGAHYRGTGDVEYLRLLDISTRMFRPDPEFQNLSMLYEPKWNGLVEGPTWDAWWVQNSYGTTYAILPFLREPYLTFLQNSQDLWFDQMGDGKRAGEKGWVAPDGSLCDAARPGWIYYKQGDGRTDIHDWGMEFTAAGVVMQAELLLIGRDDAAIAKYLPKLERCVNFIESRRDPKNNLFLAGPAGNLLAPSYAGWKKPDGTYDKAYLAGLSVTYCAALDRMIELEKLAGRPEVVKDYEQRRERVRDGLKALTTDEGYFVRSIDPDGTVHGKYGAPKHGYFEASPNHDAIAFRVVQDDAAAGRIYDKIASIPGLRPHAFVIPNYPSYDDMYEQPVGLWEFGRWVNGGHWSTCEARMILAYARLGKFDDIRRSMNQLMKFARSFRMDNPLTDFGDSVYQPNEPINLCYDSFGPPAAMMRGLFEYLYDAEGVTLVPHIPPGIISIEQRDPVRFGKNRIYLSVVGTGNVTRVVANDQPLSEGVHADRIRLAAKNIQPNMRVAIYRGDATPPAGAGIVTSRSVGRASSNQDPGWRRQCEAFVARMRSADMGDAYEAAHAQLVLDAANAGLDRRALIGAGTLKKLDNAASQQAADALYESTRGKLYDGLGKLMHQLAETGDERGKRIAAMWDESRK